MSRGRFWLIFGLLFLFACTKRLLTFCLGPGSFIGDAPEYWLHGRQVVMGDWLLLESTVDYRTPLYPVFLGLCQSLFGSHALMAVVILQHLSLLATGLLTALVCWRLTSSRVAVLLAYGCYSACLLRSWYGNVILTEPLFLFLLTSAVAALVEYHRRPRLGWAIAFAVLLAVTVLVRPVPKLLWIPLIGLFFLQATRWAYERYPLRRIAMHSIAAVAVFFLTLAPWYVRNSMVFGDLFLARLPAVNKWQVCFQGGSASRLPIPNTPAGRRVLELIGTPDGDVPDRYCYAAIGAFEQQGLSDEEIDQLVTAVCTDAIREHPFQFAWPAIKRFFNFWRTEADGIPYYASQPELLGHQSWRVEGIARVYDDILEHTPSHWLRWNELIAAMVVIGTLLLISQPRTRAVGLSLAVIFLYFPAVVAAVELENYRYRMVLEPCIVLAVVCGLASLKPRFSPAWDEFRLDIGRFSVRVLNRHGRQRRPMSPTEV